VSQQLMPKIRKPRRRTVCKIRPIDVSLRRFRFGHQRPGVPSQMPHLRPSQRSEKCIATPGRSKTPELPSNLPWLPRPSAPQSCVVSFVSGVILAEICYGDTLLQGCKTLVLTGNGQIDACGIICALRSL
jgi:hypothetical protein